MGRGGLSRGERVGGGGERREGERGRGMRLEQGRDRGKRREERQRKKRERVVAGCSIFNVDMLAAVYTTHALFSWSIQEPW